MTRPLTIILATTLLVSLVGCSGIKVESDFDPRVNFRSYETWDWMKTPTQDTGDPRLDDAILRGRIQSAVANTLLDKGFNLSLDSPDFLVAYHVAIDQKLDMEVVNNYYGYPYAGDYASVWGPAIQGQEVKTTEYEQGTLMVDVLDSTSKQLIWRGTAQAEIYPNQSPKDREKQINKAVGKIFSDFPPDN